MIVPRGKSKNENTRNTILKVSMRLFADLGYEGVAMRQIAKEVDVTLPTIYHHFGSKEDLFKAVETEMYGAHTVSLLGDLLEDATPEERLRKFMNNLMDRFESTPDFFKLVQRNLIDGKESNQGFLVKLALQGLYDELKALLNEHHAGSGDELGPVFIFSAIMGFETMRPVNRLLKGYTYAKSRHKQERAKFVDLIIAAIAAA
jgi:TetR/AcrR family transcriptional regulator